MAFKLDEKLWDKIQNDISPSYYEDGQLDLLKFSKDLDISVIDAKFDNDGVSGAIQNKNGEWSIFINYTDSPRRKRFTVAHELGHFLSYKYEGKSRNGIQDNSPHKDYAIWNRGGANTEMELEANEIAGRLLMPEGDIKRYIDQNKTIEEMAELFNVSEAAVLVRLNNLGYTMLESLISNASFTLQ